MGEVNANTHVTLLGSKCRSKENKRHKNSSSHSEKRIIGMNDNSSVLSSEEANCRYNGLVKPFTNLSSSFFFLFISLFIFYFIINHKSLKSTKVQPKYTGSIQKRSLATSGPFAWLPNYGHMNQALYKNIRVLCAYIGKN
jgi:hypothetical protein